MKPSKEDYPSSPSKRRTRPSSPTRPSRTRSMDTPSAFLQDPAFTPPPTAPPLYEDYVEVSSSAAVVEPRSFPYSVKQQCWEKAEKVKGRDPNRWRRDPLGNIVFRKLVGCPGCLCHDYDHIVPYSKGGKSTLENCQILQASVNRSKGNQTELSRAELVERSTYCRVSGRDMDLIELSAYGNVRHTQDSGGCQIQ